jgi:hypothetical protein
VNNKDWTAWFAEIWKEHSGTIKGSAILVLLAAVSYGVSLSGPVSSYRAATDLCRKIDGIPETDKEQHKQAVTDLLVAQLETVERRSFARELSGHLAIAFIVAVIIIVTVESSSASKTRREVREYRDSVAKEVWQAIFGRLVPEEITKELDSILKTTTVKENCRYVLTIKPRYPGMPEGFLVIRREVTYTLRNITPGEISRPLKISIHNQYGDMAAKDDGGKPIMLPRHVDIKIDGKAPAGGLEACLKDDEFGRKRNLNCDIPLRVGEAKEIYLCNEEQARLSDQNLYVQLGLLTSLQLFVKNFHDGIVVHPAQLHHPNGRQFKAGDDGMYQHSGGILPGQSFIVRWHEKEKAIVTIQQIMNDRKPQADNQTPAPPI